ncbi:hypothetical protein ML401_26675 [Bradyrhizobium sp. 62B]|jgi:hypothetical protein|uniref:DUF6894 family protein n=1 Tax=Bradyrhizobium TaxID=374 RepID=UPI001B8A3A9D|nr:MULTISPECIES: hypothetical protein [Bradyrhizobium]WIW45014.1 hypothetical protein ML401_26675 [Bradyrhizobium sp. 62B]MBR0700056.1 hypothetical protein [Bradyrhizobium diazoefficiens]MBR0768391.1 hypothetical protein [Bradyrhizobium diazoefficiens]MBR0928799.1 hypothetical protein [Bradyrhizobium diazoefficiens]MCS3762930.1 hypothetical protein [Bradyrhizobium centrosematis]
MSHFYFDIWDGEALVVDEEGLDLAGQRAAEVEAAMSLADIARQLEPLASSDGLAVNVRDASGPVLRAIFVCEKVQPIN